MTVWLLTDAAGKFVALFPCQADLYDFLAYVPRRDVKSMKYRQVERDRIWDVIAMADNAAFANVPGPAQR